MNTRDQIISFLLQANDVKDQTIAELQKKITILEKTLADTNPAPTPETVG